ncbi:CrcB family protein [Egicoccus halophilus]|uniref:CrcB family protein n=1 Tax=Egicoccus halophilus TaxID=1670830 RepID=UPI0013EECF7D|nr:CrcB family protein [Egicoccus halophilus]
MAVGGAVGSLLRAGAVLAVLSAVHSELVPLLVLNVTGTYLLARLVVGARHDPRRRARLPLLGTGLLGALTTFSGLVVPLALLLVDGAGPLALVWAASSLAGGVAAAAAGLRRGGT